MADNFLERQREEALARQQRLQRQKERHRKELEQQYREYLKKKEENK